MAAQTLLASQQALFDALSARFKAAGEAVDVFETHISWVLVAGRFAYKFKKAVRFDFLDFSTLESRRFYCIEELRLNRRLAPAIYLDVIAVTGTPLCPEPGGSGTPIEYAVKMRAFEQTALWSYRVSQGLIDSREIDGLAIDLASFHRNAAVAPADSEWCLPPAIAAIAHDNLEAIAAAVNRPARIARLRDWDASRRATLREVFVARKANGAVRECHGDLHAGNIVTIDGRSEAFDCIEFSPALRWNDVMYDVAFLAMDLAVRGRADLAARFINRYLEAGGDYDGLELLRYYQVQRALVRCKVALLRAAQVENAAPRNRATLHREWRRQANSYLAYAVAAIAPASPVLMITHGLSGCGKSTLARQVVELLGAVQLRSDAERKRLHDVPATARGDARLYSADASTRTYRRLLELAAFALRAGWPVIVDAAFLEARQRLPFARLAADLGVPFFIFDVHNSETTMRQRVAAREREGTDASDAGIAVLEMQLASHQPLGEAELGHTIRIDMESGMTRDALRRACTPIPLKPMPFRRHGTGAASAP